MKKLTIIRHAKSSWEHPEVDDLSRPLNDRGKRAIPLIGNFLLLKKNIPDLIMSSPADRAMQTAIGIGEIMGYKKEKIRIFRDIYFGDASAVLQLLQNSDNKYRNLFLFGHEPILSSLIFKLTGDSLEKFPTCSAYCILFDIKMWRGLKLNSGICEFFVNPKLLGEK